MTPTQIEAAAERIMSAAEHEASPGNMSPAEAVDFYEQLRDRVRDWIETIKSENGLD